jgi:hypothetical protein
VKIDRCVGLTEIGMRDQITTLSIITVINNYIRRTICLNIIRLL